MLTGLPAEGVLMWIVRLALRRPYTFVVLSLLLFFLGPVVIERTPVDIFPDIDIPVVSVIWQYAGLSPQQLSDRITVQFERSLTTTVNDIEHTESQTLNGIAVIKVYFQPNVNISQAVAQVTAIAQTALRTYPPGTTPPLVIQYSASSVPVLQLGLSGAGLTEQQLNDFGTNFIRTRLATVQGAAVPSAYGGKLRQIQVDIDTQKLQAHGVSAADVVNTMGAQNIILPAGDVKMGHVDYQIETNSAPDSVAALNDLPIKTVNGSTVYIHDIGNVRDGFPPQTNIVRVDGQRASLMTILKTGNASTLDIISNVRKQLPLIAAQLPQALRIRPISDQSVFVKSAISGVAREAIIAGCLTAAMILIFLGSWRSTLIIAVSIPLSILCSLLMLSALGETINIMTLGGLALAVGILGQCHRRHRKHQSLSGTGRAGRAGHSGRRRADRPANPGLDLRHLHCVCTDVLPRRRRALPLRPIGRGGRLRRACVVLSVADRCADHGQVSAQGARARPRAAGARQPQSIRAIPDYV